jgi:hypothetical protein
MVEPWYPVCYNAYESKRKPFIERAGIMKTYKYVVMRKGTMNYKYPPEVLADSDWLENTGVQHDTCIATFTSSIPHMIQENSHIPYTLPEWEYIAMIPEHCLFD